MLLQMMKQDNYLFVYFFTILMSFIYQYMKRTARATIEFGYPKFVFLVKVFDNFYSTLFFSQFSKGIIGVASFYIYLVFHTILYVILNTGIIYVLFNKIMSCFCKNLRFPMLPSKVLLELTILDQITNVFAVITIPTLLALDTYFSIRRQNPCTLQCDINFYLDVSFLNKKYEKIIFTYIIVLAIKAIGFISCYFYLNRQHAIEENKDFVICGIYIYKKREDMPTKEEKETLSQIFVRHMNQNAFFFTIMCIEVVRSAISTYQSIYDLHPSFIVSASS